MDVIDRLIGGKHQHDNMFGKLLCRIGIHWMSGHTSNFVDIVSGKTVFNATCPCGKKWIVDTLFSLPTFKIERDD